MFEFVEKSHPALRPMYGPVQSGTGWASAGPPIIAATAAVPNKNFLMRSPLWASARLCRSAKKRRKPKRCVYKSVDNGQPAKPLHFGHMPNAVWRLGSKTPRSANHPEQMGWMAPAPGVEAPRWWLSCKPRALGATRHGYYNDRPLPGQERLTSSRNHQRRRGRRPSGAETGSGDAVLQ